jgi:hypothetical protein
MKTRALLVGILLAFTACSKTVYLRSEAYVVGLQDNYVTVRFNCANVRRPDCYAILNVDRSLLGEVSIGQQLKLK